MAREQKIRAFLAVPLAELFQSEITPLLSQLQETYPAIRWVAAKNVHLTLHFFGPIEPEKIKEVSRIVGPFLKTQKAFTLSLEGLGVFPNLKHPRVIWAGIRGDVQSLQSLQGRIEILLKKEGFECEVREFKPHLTLGRPGKGRGISNFVPFPFGPTPDRRINEAILFRSDLTPQGPHYEAIETYPFSTT